MSFHYYDSEDNGECAIAKSLLEQKVGSVFMQEVITGGALRICHIIQIQSLPKKFAEACRSYKTNKIAKRNEIKDTKK